MKQRRSFTFLIVAVPVSAAVLVMNSLNQPRGWQPDDAAVPARSESIPLRVEKVCADIWSGEHIPRLSYEMWCADNAPGGMKPPSNMLAGEQER